MSCSQAPSFSQTPLCAHGGQVRQEKKSHFSRDADKVRTADTPTASEPPTTRKKSLGTLQQLIKFLLILPHSNRFVKQMTGILSLSPEKIRRRAAKTIYHYNVKSAARPVKSRKMSEIAEKPADPPGADAKRLSRAVPRTPPKRKRRSSAGRGAERDRRCASFKSAAPPPGKAKEALGTLLPEGLSHCPDLRRVSRCGR